MAIAAPLTSDRSAGQPARITRVAIAGATGFAGQELVRILARHPAVTLTTAMSSAATSTPRPMPALARIWDGEVVTCPWHSLEFHVPTGRCVAFADIRLRTYEVRVTDDGALRVVV